MINSLSEKIQKLGGRSEEAQIEQNKELKKLKDSIKELEKKLKKSKKSVKLYKTRAEVLEKGLVSDSDE